MILLLMRNTSLLFFSSYVFFFSSLISLTTPLLYSTISHIFTQIIYIFLLLATSEDMPDFFKRGPGNERYVEVKHVLSPPLLEDATVKSLILHLNLIEFINPHLSHGYRKNIYQDLFIFATV